MADEAFSVSDMFCPIARREIDFVYIHSVGISLRGSASWRNVTVSSSSEFPESYHVLVELPGLVQPLFPFPSSLPIREGGGSHHDSELLGYSLLKGVAHAPPAMVLFFLFLFLPLLFAFMLTAVAVLCKPGCAVRAADTSSV